MHLSQLQTERRVWVERNFPGDQEVHSILGAVEELGELAHAFLKREQGIRGTTEEHTEAIKDACADLIIFLCGVADHEGFDLGLVVAQTWDSVKQRDWVNQPFDGMEKPQQQTLGNMGTVDYRPPFEREHVECDHAAGWRRNVTTGKLECMACGVVA